MIFRWDMAISRLWWWRIFAILNFIGPIMGFLKSPCTTSYRSSIETRALNCLVFEKIAFLCTDFGDRWAYKRTDGQGRCVRRLRYGERRLSNGEFACRRSYRRLCCHFTNRQHVDVVVSATEKTDHSVENKLMTVIWSHGQKDGDTPGLGYFYRPDEVKVHSRNNRGKIVMNFHGEFQCNNNRSISQSINQSIFRVA